MAEDPQTWTELKAALATWTIRDDLTAIIPEAIAYAERGFQRSIFTPDRIATTTLSFSSDTAALPSDFWGVETAYTGSNPKYLLEQVTVGNLRRDYPFTATGTPRVFAIEGSNMVLGPPPSTADVELTYWQTIPALDASMATNWLLTRHPELYVAASLAWLHEYVRDEIQAGRWTARAVAYTNDINKSGMRRRNNSGPIAARPSRSDSLLSFFRS